MTARTIELTKLIQGTRRSLLAGTIPLFLLACGGAGAVHNGYPGGETEPWSSPTKLKLSDNGEASAEGSVSFPKRERAKWYVVDLPAAGALSAKLKMEATSTGADVGFEILDEGFNVVVPATNDDDLGQEEKVREVKEARAGNTYLHVFTLGKSDAADFKVRVRFTPTEGGERHAAVASESDEAGAKGFPSTVPNLPALPAVPAKDDAPGKRGRKPVEETVVEEKPPVEEPDPAAGPSVKGQIIEFSSAGRGVKIVINRGSGSNVEEGWTGYVVDSKGKSIKNGAFKVKKVKQDESEGTVNTTMDTIQHNRGVVLKAPQ